MLQSTGSQRVGQDLKTEQQQRILSNVTIAISEYSQQTCRKWFKSIRSYNLAVTSISYEYYHQSVFLSL